jgi:hypothetical protein
VSIPFPVTDRHVTWNAAVYIDGVYYRCVTFPRRRIGYNQQRSNCTVVLDRYVEITTGEPLSAYVVINAAGVDGVTARRRFFTGFADQPVVSVAPFGFRLTLIDILGQLDKPLSSDLTWNDRPFTDAVTDLLTDAGIDSALIGDIYDPGTDYNLCPVESITLEAGAENVAKLIDELMKFASCAIWVTPGGVIRVSYDLDIPQETGAHTYIYDDPTGDQRGIYAGYSDEAGSFESVIAGWVARGRKLSDGTTPNFTFTATGVSGKTGSGTYRFAQSNAVCELIAKRETAKGIRAKRTLQIPCAMDADLLPATTITLDIPNRQGYVVATTAIVRSADTSQGTMTLNCSLGVPDLTGTGFSDDDKEKIGITDPGYPEEPPLFVDFTLTVDTEPIDTGAGLADRLFVHVDATQSDDGTRTWTVTGATPTPSTPVTGNTASFVLDTGDPTSVTISLEVDDGVKTPQSISKSLDTVDVQSLFRPLSTATGSNGHRLLTVDGWTAHTRAGQTCTAVSKFNPNGAWSGWDDGALYQWLYPDPTALIWTHPSNTQIDVIWIPEEEQTIVLVAAGSDLYLSTDEGASFTLLRSNAAIADVSTPPDNADYIRICEGADVLESFDGGASWATAIAGAGGSTAEQLADAPWGNAAVFSSAGSSADALKIQQGYTVDWNAVGAAPTSLTAITPLATEPGYIAGDASGNLYLLLQNGVNFDATDIGTNTSGNTASLLRDGAVGGDSPFNDLCYIGDVGTGTNQGTLKIINNDITTLLRIDDVSTATTAIGYLPVGATKLEFAYMFFLAQQGVASAGVYEYNSATGGTPTLRNSGIPAALTHVLWLSGNPINTDELIAVIHAGAAASVSDSGGKLRTGTTSHSPLWRYTISTQTWSEIVISVSSTVSGNLYRADYDPETLGRWVSNVETTGYDVYALIGTDLTGSETTVAATSPLRYLSFGPGQDGDLVLSQNFPLDRVAYLTSSGTLVEPSPAGGADNAWFLADRYPDNRQMVFTDDEGNLLAKEDYRGSAAVINLTAFFPFAFVEVATWPSSSTSSAPAAFTIPTTINNRLVYAAGSAGPTASGIYEVTNPFSASPGYSIVALSGETIGWIRADRATNSLVSLMLDFSGTPEVGIWNGATVSRVDVSSLSNIAALVEVVKQ